MATKKTFLSLPPDLQCKIFGKLPLTDYVSIALVSRRFKVLLYNESIYGQKLEALGVQFDDEEADETIQNLTQKMKQLPGGHLLPVGSNYLQRGTMFDGDDEELIDLDEKLLHRHLHAENAQESNKEASDPSNAEKKTIVIGAGGLRGMKKNKIKLGQKRVQKDFNKREAFIKIISELKGFYFDFRKRQKDSKVFKEFTDITEVATVLNRLKILHKAHFYEEVEDIEFNLNSAFEWFETFVLGQFERAYDARNIADMKQAATALYRLDGGATCVQLFVEKNPIFFDSTFNPTLVGAKLPSPGAIAAGYTLANDFAAFMDHMLEQSKEQVEIIAQVFVPEMDTMTVFVNRIFEESISEYLSAVLKSAKEGEGAKVYLHTLASAVYCCSQFLGYLKKNGKVPVHIDGIKKSVVAILKPYTEKYLVLELEYMQKRFATEVEAWTKSRALSGKHLENVDYLADQEAAMAHKRQVMQIFKSVLFAPVVLTTNLASNTLKLFSIAKSSMKQDSQSLLSDAEPIKKEEQPAQTATTYKLDNGSMTSLLSLEFCMQLLHINKEALGRALVVTFTVDPARTKQNVEKIFISLLKLLGEQHIRPAFDKAIKQLSNFVPNDHYDVEHSISADSLQFFEMVHLADLISQMVDTYYQEDIRVWIDENDFLSEIVVEKKAFERILDGSVASGMDKAVQVMVNQAEFILMKEHVAADYNPTNSRFDLTPTKACTNVIKSIRQHVKLLTGATDKNTMEVFLTEIGVRLFNVITKHIKHSVISQTGAMRLICDLNTYYDWACSLRVGQVTKLFSVLKEVGNLYIADGGYELRDLVNDPNRFQGVLRLEEIIELLASRADYKQIQKYIESKECVIQ